MSPLIVFTALFASALAAPQAIQPLAYAAATPYHAQYTPGYSPLSYSAPAYSPLGYTAPAYKPYTAFAAAPVAPVTPFKAYTAAPVAPITPFKAYTPAPVAPVAPAIQPYHAYHQFAGQHQYVKPIAIVRYNQDDNFDGTFTYDFEGENGIANQASGYVKAIGPNEQAQVMQGQYSYTAPDGTPIVTRWFADETGFHAEGAHLPENVAKTLPYKTA